MNSSIVACPGWLIPSRFRIFPIVMAIILMSSHNDWWSTYHTSSRNFSSQLMALRPLTWAQPVIPGRTSWRRACSGVYRSRYCMRRGRGPTKLISPFKTLNNSGNSSRLVARRNRPRTVRRSESGRRASLASRASVIVRYFRSQNGLPFSPGRSCRKNTDVPNLVLTKNATTAKSGQIRHRTTLETINIMILLFLFRLEAERDSSQLFYRQFHQISEVFFADARVRAV